MWCLLTPEAQQGDNDGTDWVIMMVLTGCKGSTPEIVVVTVVMSVAVGFVVFGSSC